MSRKNYQIFYVPSLSFQNALWRKKMRHWEKNKVADLQNKSTYGMFTKVVLTPETSG